VRPPGEVLSKPHLFDCNVLLGHRRAGGAHSFVTAEELVRELDRVGIEEALVCHADAVECEPELGNCALLEMVRGQARLHPAWVCAPETPEADGGGERFVAHMLEAGVRLVRLFPTDFAHKLRPWTCADLLGACAERQVPVMVDFSSGHWMQPAADWDGVHAVCARRPELPFILAHANIGSPRDLYPLLALHPRLYVETSYFLPQGGLEYVAGRFGAQRLLFGSAMPVYDAGGPLAMLAASALGQRQRVQVGGANLRELLEAAG